MMQYIRTILAESLGWYRRDEDGSVVVESAITIAILGTMMIGVIDYGLAFNRKMEVSNAVRSASQYAIVRRASQSAEADFEPALISINEVKNAVVNTADFITADNVDENVDVAIFCLCAGFANEENCSALPTPCDSSAFIRITVRHAHQLMFNYPGLPQTLNMADTHVVRLN